MGCHRRFGSTKLDTQSLFAAMMHPSQEYRAIVQKRREGDDFVEDDGGSSER